MFPRAFDQNMADATLRRLKVGVVVADAGGHVLAANPAAAVHIDIRDGLAVEEGGRLAAELNGQTARLRLEIRNAALHGLAQAVQLRRSRHEKPLTVAVAPFSEAAADHRVLITVHDPARPPECLMEQVRGIFRLSPAEAEVAVGLAEGAELVEIATRRGVSLNTARAQLASAMNKTGVRRQAELVAAVLNAGAAAC